MSNFELKDWQKRVIDAFNRGDAKYRREVLHEKGERGLGYGYCERCGEAKVRVESPTGGWYTDCPNAATTCKGASPALPPRELHCEDCDRDYVVWFAPNDLWNRVVRAKYPDGPDPFLCPTCFTVRADKDGVKYTAFEVRVENLNARATGGTDNG